MCLQTTTTYDNCCAVRVHLDVCASHVEHTRLQLDSAPCPNFEKVHQHVKHTTRCYCKNASASLGREAGFAVGVGCNRMASRGYGEDGFTWSFEKDPDLKEKRERAREENGKVEEKEVEVNMEEGEDDVMKSWADFEAAGGFGGANGGAFPSGAAEDAIRRNQMVEEQDYQQSKKVKVQDSSGFAPCPPLTPFKSRSYDGDHEMN
ncbi:hypothetical protein BKA64DRAFT_743353 [Cadophora sp. MPI-SDFR-AT-0126]|nr:hypothetical protein BKA64DRAFT_743353 [Leotiomycetes sp. MPI-SDFR-AT-0126]